MGVKSLWSLLASSGVIIQPESLEGKILAIDTSIWLYQFIKAMRTETGEMLPNAHLIGMFRRICKLLFWRVRPVFVFDGDTLHLKKQTAARRRAIKTKSSSDASQAAHKLLQNRLRQSLLEKEIENRNASQQQKQEEGGGGKKHPQNQTNVENELDDKISSTNNVIEISDNDDDDDDDKDDAENSVVSVSDDSFDALYDYDDTEAQEMLAAYRRMMNNDLPDIDEDVLATLDERVQLDFLLGVREVYRQQNKQRIRQMLYNQEDKVAKDPQSFSELQLNALLGRSRLRQQETVVRARMNQTAGQRMVSDPSTMLIYQSDDEVAPLHGDPNQQQILSNNFEDDDDSIGPGGGFLTFENENDSDGDDDNNTDYNNNTSNVDTNLSVSQNSIDSDQDIEDKIVHNLTPTNAKPISSAKAIDTNTDVTVRVMDGTNIDKDTSNRRSSEDVVVTHAVPVPVVAVDDSSASKDAVDDMFAKTLSFYESLEREKSQKSVNDQQNQMIVDVDEWSNSEDVVEIVQSNEIITTINSTPSNDNDDSEKKKSPLSTNLPTITNQALHTTPHNQKKPKRMITSAQDTISSIEPTSNEQASKSEKSLEKPANEKQQNDEPTQKDKPRHNNHARNDTQIHINHETLEKNDENQQSRLKKKNNKLNTGNGKHSKLVSTKSEEAQQQKDNAKQIQENIETQKPKQQQPQQQLQQQLQQPPHQPQQQPQQEHQQPNQKQQPQQPQTHHQPAQHKPVESFPIDNDPPSFAPTSNDDVRVVPNHWADDVDVLRQQLAAEAASLRAEHRRAAVAADTVTPELVADCKLLLRLFGIPWIDAPFEAEAQCADLELKGLVDGVISDDSDTLLFGARTCYRHMFRTDADLQVFTSESIQSKCGLNRKDLAELALLLGSDYTMGVRGVGHVLATELLAIFKPLGGMQALRQWYDKGIDSFNHSFDASTRIKLNKLRPKLLLPESFPNRHIIDAYMNPNVSNDIDASTSFSWAIPAFGALREWAAERFGWTASHTDSQLRLVLERYSSTLGAPRQRRLDSFFKALKPAPIKRSSSRLNNALANLRGDHVAVTSSPQSSSSSSRKRKTTSNKNATKKKKKTQEIDDDIDEFIIDNHDIVNSNQNSGKKLNSKPRQKLNNDNNSNRKSRKLLKTKIHTTQSTKRTRPSKPRKAKKKQ